MIKFPKSGTFWRYALNLPGRNEIHKVIFSQPEEVITLGERHSWLGSSEDFQKSFEFQPTQETPKPQ